MLAMGVEPGFWGCQDWPVSISRVVLGLWEVRRVAAKVGIHHIHPLLTFWPVWGWIDFWDRGMELTRALLALKTLLGS